MEKIVIGKGAGAGAEIEEGGRGNGATATGIATETATGIATETATGIATGIVIGTPGAVGETEAGETKNVIVTVIVTVGQKAEIEIGVGAAVAEGQALSDELNSC